MRLLALVAALLTLSACGRTGNAPAADTPTGEATLRPDTTIVDLGVVGAEDIVSTTVGVSNSGTRTAKVTAVETDCSCLDARMESSAVEPGQRSRLRIEFDARGTFGKQYHKATVKSDAAADLEIVVVADIRPTY